MALSRAFAHFPGGLRAAAAAVVVVGEAKDMKRTLVPATRTEVPCSASQAVYEGRGGLVRGCGEARGLELRRSS